MDSIETLWTTSILLGVATLALSLIAWRLQHGYSNQFAKLPRIGTDPGVMGLWLTSARKDFVRNGSQLVHHGYSKFKEGKYRVQTMDMERLILSNRFIPELSRLPEDQLSVSAALSARHLGKYTTLDFVTHSSVQVEVCRLHLTHDLGIIGGDILEEIEYGLELELPASTEWGNINAFDSLRRVVARTSARIFVGLPVCRDERWLETSIGFAADVFNTATDLRPYMNPMRPMIAPFLSSRKRLLEQVRIATEILQPVVQRFLNDKVRGNFDRKTSPAIFWMMTSRELGEKTVDTQEIAIMQLFLSLASIHTTTTTIINALYDLCVHTEYIKPLREECLAALENEKWTHASVRKLCKMDSFLKESQRLNHPGLFAFNRMTLKTTKLSDGFTIPPGTLVGVATSNISRDPEYYPDPERFDGFRFYKLAAESSNPNSYQFCSTSPQSMAFGHGSRACPGRFFAAYQLKLLLGNILLKYDFQFADGTKERPKDVNYGEHIVPDRTKMVSFRKRTR